MKDLTFYINKNWDIQTFTQFVGRDEGVFEDVVKTYYPELDLGTKSQNEIFQFIEEFYVYHQEELDQAMHRAEQEWATISRSVNKKVHEIFKSYDFEEEELFCAVGMNPFSPRFLDLKVFIYFFKGNPLHIIPHEVLHFYFFEYVEAKHGDTFANFDRDSGPYFQLSELFNNVVLELEFTDILGGSYEEPYDENSQYVQKFKQLYLDVHKDIDEFILGGFEILKV